MFERVPGKYNLELMDKYWKKDWNNLMEVIMLYLGHNCGAVVHWPNTVATTH